MGENPAGGGGEARSTDGLSFAVVREHWDGLVQAVRDAKPSLALFLSGATLISLEGHVLKLGFGADDRFAMTQVIKNRDNIEQICAEKLGQRVRLEGRRAKRRGAARIRPYRSLGARHFRRRAGLTPVAA